MGLLRLSRYGFNKTASVLKKPNQRKMRSLLHTLESGQVYTEHCRRSLIERSRESSTDKLLVKGTFRDGARKLSGISQLHLVLRTPSLTREAWRLHKWLRLEKLARFQGLVSDLLSSRTFCKIRVQELR
jgi:hypothetical protein